MNYHPTRFNDAMVRAYLASTKTQHRVPIKSQPTRVEDGMFGERWAWGDYNGVPEMLAIVMERHGPFGVPSDRLWIREAWNICAWGGSSDYVGIRYRADRATRVFQGMQWAACKAWRNYGTKGRASTHMPRWASRFTLPVTRVWVERIEDISEDDAKAEGITDVGNTGVTWWDGTMRGTGKMCHGNARTAFLHLWDSIYAKRGLGWDANPWAWGCEFEPFKKGNK